MRTRRDSHLEDVQVVIDQQSAVAGDGQAGEGVIAVAEAAAAAATASAAALGWLKRRAS